MTGPVLIGAMGVTLAGLSAYLHVRGHDGGGWGIVALMLIVTSCSHAT